MPVPIPVIVISKGFSSLSLFAMCSAAVFRPVLTGVNRTVKVVLPPGITGAMGLVVTVNMAEFTPSTVILEIMRFELPIFLMVKVRLVLVPTATEPKSLVLTPETRFVPGGC